MSIRSSDDIYAVRAMKLLMDGKRDEAHALLIAVDDASLEAMERVLLPQLYAQLKEMALAIDRPGRRRRALARMDAQERIAIAAVRRALEHRRKLA